MATRKKKTESAQVDVPTIDWPQVTVGTHLTVTTYEDGRTELVWDDDALLNEVRDAILSVELADKKPAVKAKAITRKKKVQND